MRVEQADNLGLHLRLGPWIEVMFGNFADHCALLGVKLADQLQAGLEQLRRERLTQRTSRGFGILAEVFEVLAVVEDVEKLFVQPRALCRSAELSRVRSAT